jgi:hypothetical protein
VDARHAAQLNVRTSTLLLLFGLAGAIGLWVWSRTKSGQGAAQSAAEFIDVSASRIAHAITSRGYRNNNPGNMRFIAASPFNGQVGNDAGFGIYDTAANGTRALGKQLQAYERRGLNTVREIISTWSPPAENDTAAYVADVAGQLGVDADQVINVTAELAVLAEAIARHENGYVDSAYDWTWVYLP